MTNAFADAAAQVSQNASTPAAASSTNPLPFNNTNPFAKASDFGGSGDFTPTPTMDVLVGRTLVYIPRSFNPAAPDPFNVGQTRAQWTADLYVLDGGELRFWYKQRGDRNATPPTPDTDVEHVSVVTPTEPYVAKGTWVSQSAFIKKLQGASDNRQFLVATPQRGAQKQQRDQGMTDADVRTAHANWIARGKQGAEPKFVWLLADVSDEGMKNVYTWYEAFKDKLGV